MQRSAICTMYLDYIHKNYQVVKTGVKKKIFYFSSGIEILNLLPTLTFSAYIPPRRPIGSVRIVVANVCFAMSLPPSPLVGLNYR